MATLYEIASMEVARNIERHSHDLKNFPGTMLCDIYGKLLMQGRIKQLFDEIKDVTHFTRLLKSVDNWMVLFQSVHAIEIQLGLHFSFQLASEVSQLCSVTHSCYKMGHCEIQHVLSHTESALLLGIFFMECGMYGSASCALSCVQKCDSGEHTVLMEMAFEMWTRLIHTLTADCKFNEAGRALFCARSILDYLQKHNSKRKINKAMFYTANSLYLFAKSFYDKAHEYALSGLAELQRNLPTKMIVDTLRQAAKTSIIKREFKQAESLIKQAVYLAREHFGQEHPKYAECLCDYGFYLLNVDAVTSSVQVYELSLKIREKIFGTNNLLLAMSHEDLAYALYVRDYSTGAFSKARLHAEVAIKVLTQLLPSDHLLLASSKRVKALILEEVAIESSEKEEELKLLLEAEQLHLESLKLAKKAFGESNVQTAKHYGNLGRLYQSMKRYREAEQMHLRAIEIKENLLGKEDYEVALSLGHLASLYNYDMRNFGKAEELYIRSIRIGCKLFGEGFSGLEYDYRGLINLYSITGNYVEMARYHMVLADWQDLRQSANEQLQPLTEELETQHPKTLDEFLYDFHMAFKQPYGKKK